MAATVYDDEKLREFATEAQLRWLDAVKKHGSTRAAAKALGVHHSSVSKGLLRLKKKARMAGYDPEAGMRHAVGEPYYVKGVSSYYGPDGALKGQWVKTSIDMDARAEAIEEFLDSRMQEQEPVKPVSRCAGKTNKHLCNLYTMTDCHVGMLAWGKENGGQPWDLKIAERTLKGCFAEMMARAPDAHTCVINQLGDWMHVDKIEPMTPASGHILDADIRFPKIVATAIGILEWMCIEALKKHEKVVLICAEGNHDPVSSVWMRILFQRLFRDNPRLMVDDSEAPYYVYQHGKTMLAFHHGHKKRFQELPTMFAARYPEVWGATKYRYGHSGHMHHKSVLDLPGMRWIQHPTLAAPDSYTVRGGWESMREAEVIIYHDEYGSVGGATVRPEMLMG